MEDVLIAILEAYDVPVYRQGSMSDGDIYPETFITFWNDGSPDHAHYDNDNYGTAWQYTVNVYSSDPAVPYSMMDSIRTALKAAGWIVDGRGYDTPSDEATHTGRGVVCYYLET